jgi:hypothetical protein
MKKKRLFVSLFVSGSKEHYRQGYWVWEVTAAGGVVRYEELEYEVLLPRNPIGRRGTNGNRVRRKHVILRYLAAGNINPGSKHLEILLPDREPMKIEFSENGSRRLFRLKILIFEYVLLEVLLVGQWPTEIEFSEKDEKRNWGMRSCGSAALN